MPRWRAALRNLIHASLSRRAASREGVAGCSRAARSEKRAPQVLELPGQPLAVIHERLNPARGADAAGQHALGALVELQGFAHISLPVSCPSPSEPSRSFL